METGPKYDLDRIKKLLCDSTSCHITETAHTGAASIGYMDGEAIIDVVEDIETGDYHKSLPPVQNFPLWQDVYKTVHNNNSIYVKLAMNPKGNKVIIAQFKKQ